VGVANQEKYPYKVNDVNVEEFKKAYPCIKEFLQKFEENDKTYYEKSIGIVRFFNWLKTVKNIEITPTDFLNQHIKNRAANDIEARRWALRLALDYSKHNPDLKGKTASYKYTAWFLPVKQFCDYNEVPLTTTNGFFPNKERKKYPERPFTADFIRKILACLNQRDRAVCMCELQAGQAIQQVLVDMNRQARRVFRLIDEGAERIRFDFEERKGNGFHYFSFISHDAIQEIQKWRPIRQRILDNLGTHSDYIFITERGTQYIPKHFHNYVREAYIRHGVYNGPRSISSHGFRKFFEQESSPPERGISKSYVTFMMGHSEGKDSCGMKVTHPLDAVGGVYDKAPLVYPQAVEKEYAKLEPYLNVYSCRASDSPSELQGELLKRDKQIAELQEIVAPFRDVDLGSLIRVLSFNESKITDLMTTDPKIARAAIETNVNVEQELQRRKVFTNK
jgi:integrase